MARIGRMGRSLVGGTPERITLHFFGALSHTYKGHASDSAVVAGLIGEREDSPNVRHALRLAAERGVEVEIRTHPDSGRNPNTVSMELVRGGRTYAVAGVSVGGGEIEMTELEGFPVCLRGNEDGALFIGPDGLGRAVFEERLGALSGFSCVKDGERALYLCLAEKPFPDGMDMPGLEMFPVRNILGNKLADAEPLFSTLAAMAEMAGGDLPGLIERYEARRSGVDRDTIRAAVLGSWEIMKASMTDGLAGKSDMLAGLVPGDAGFRLARRVESGQALSGRTIGMAVARALAVMENNGSMRCVVAAPTAGACGVLPGAFLSAAEERGLGDDAIVDGLLVAAAVGVLVAMRAPISGAIGGCQSEIGLAAGLRTRLSTRRPSPSSIFSGSSAILWPGRWKSHASSATPWASPTLSRRRTWPLPESPAAFLPTRWSTRSSTCRASFIPICAATCVGASPPPRRAGPSRMNGTHE